MQSKANVEVTKGKKKKTMKDKQTEEEITAGLSGIVKNGIAIRVVHLEIQEGTVEMGWTGFLRVSFGPAVVGLVEVGGVPSLGGRVSLDYSCFLHLPELDHAALDALVSTPLFFTLGAKKGRTSEKGGESGVVGQGNMDMLPLILGRTGRAESVVVLERSGYVDTLFFPAGLWECPRLLVELAEMGDWSADLPDHNVLWLSVESLYDPGPPYLTPEAEYTLVFPIPRQAVHLEDDKHDGDGEAKVGVKDGDKNNFRYPDLGRNKQDGGDTTNRQELSESESSNTSEEDSTSQHLAMDSTKPGKKRLDTSDSKKVGGNEGAKRKEKISDRLMDFRLVEFPQGEWKEGPIFDLRKKWSTLANVNGGPAKHSDRVRSDSGGLFSKIKLDLGRKMAAEREPRIVWNMVRPIWLDEETEQIMIQWIYKYGVWPVELVVAGGEETVNESSATLKSKRKKDRNVRSFIAWLDLSVLLFPGNESVRVAGQVQLFDQAEGEALWGLASMLVACPAETLTSLESSGKRKGYTRRDSTRKVPPSEQTLSYSQKCAANHDVYRFSQMQGDLLELRSKYEALKKLALGSESSVLLSEDEEADTGEAEDEEEQALRSLVDAKDALQNWSKLMKEKYLLKRCNLLTMRKEMEKIGGEGVELLLGPRGPTLLVLEFKLKRPLVPRRSQQELQHNIRKYIPDRKEEVAVPKKRFSNADFQSSILKLCGLITREYNDYTGFDNDSEMPLDNEKFFEHLERSMVHLQISETLREVLSSYILDTVGSPQAGLDLNPSINRDYLDWAYCQVMEEVSSVVNRFVTEGDREVVSSPDISSREYLAFAVEAAEEGDYHRAKLYLNKLLEGEGAKEADAWSSYAVVALRMGDYPRAVQCLREALLLNIRHKESLVMYGVLLTSAGLFDGAELFLSAVIDFYPTFTEGWLILHIFYLLIERRVGADTTLIMSWKCKEEEGELQSYRPPLLSWDPTFLPADHSLFLTTAIYLLSFNLYEMAEVCLAQDLDGNAPKTEAFNYYLAICHHVQGRYEDSSHHILKTFENNSEVKMDPRMWIVLGHNRWKLGQKGEAVKLYREAFLAGEMATINTSTHMALLRCGYYFLDCGKPDLARQMFLLALKNLGTPMVWMGLGMSLYELGELEEAELALEEANLEDSQLGVVWAYLALISLHKDNFLPAQQCFFEAKRCGLNDQSIEEKFTSLTKIKTQDSYYNFKVNFGSQIF